MIIPFIYLFVASSQKYLRPRFKISLLENLLKF
jgi:hypothetical protein